MPYATEQQLSAIVDRLSAENKALRTLLNGNISSLNSLSTTNKANLVAAINELRLAARPTLYEQFLKPARFWTEFGNSNGNALGDFVGQSIGTGGTINVAAGPPISGHPGNSRLLSGANANSGFSVCTNTNNLVMSGGESGLACFALNTANNAIVGRIGFINSATVTAPTDGVMVGLNGASNTLTAYTVNSGTLSSSANSPVLSASTWYTLLINLSANRATASFELRNDAGIVVWTTTLTTNIPAINRALGFGAAFWHTGSAATNLINFDVLGCEFPVSRGVLS